MSRAPGAACIVGAAHPPAERARISDNISDELADDLADELGLARRLARPQRDSNRNTLREHVELTAGDRVEYVRVVERKGAKVPNEAGGHGGNDQ